MFYPDYKETTCICDVVKRETSEGSTYVPDLPDLSYGLVLVFCAGNNYYAYPLPASLEGKSCVCHVVYHSKDEAVMNKFNNRIGEGNAVTKLASYKGIVKKTVRDVKIADEQAKLKAEAEAEGKEVNQAELDKVDYTGDDALDGYPVWVFLQSNYKDS